MEQSTTTITQESIKEESLKFQTGTLIPERSDVKYRDENGKVLNHMRDFAIPKIKKILV